MVSSRAPVRPVRLALIAVAAAVAGLLLSGCVSPVPEPTPPDRVATVTTLPADFLTVAADPDAVRNAITVSTALYFGAGLVVTAPVGKPGAQLLAASAAVSLGVPMLLMPPFGSDSSAAVNTEISRLGADHVLNIGGSGGVPATSAAVNALLPRPLPVVEVASAATALGALATATPDRPTLLVLKGTATPTAETPAVTPTQSPTQSPTRSQTSSLDGPLPEVIRSAVPPGGVLLAVDDPDQIAAVATARSAAVDVQLLPAAQVNPQAHPNLIAALHDAAPTAVLAVGAPFAAEAGLDWKMRTAVSGAQLPGGGLTLFPDRRFVALYGTPGAPVLGVLGEQPVAESIVRAQQTAAAYAPLSDRPVIALHEIIATVAATVAAAEAGPDGNYSSEISAEQLRPWVEAAGAAGLYVVLDLQPGRSDFLSQAQQYESLLVLPYVGPALDPEWRLGPDQRHLAQIGGVTAEEINTVTTWLADLTAQQRLPQKLLVVHQFRASMIANRESLNTTRPELAILLHVDGLGAQPDKQSTWAALHADAPAGIAWGWKNFYDEDIPVLSPEQTMAQVAPTPDLVTYQ